jgi:hypothetical protein
MTGRQMLLAAALLTTAMGLGPADVALANGNCTVNTLHGLYVFSATGFIIPAAPASAQPKAIVEFIRFNGDGTIDGRAATRSLNGVIGQFPDQSGPGGTYTVTSLATRDRGCLGTLTFAGGPHFDLFIPLDGQEIWMIQTDPGNVLQGTVTKLSN